MLRSSRRSALGRPFFRASVASLGLVGAILLLSPGQLGADEPNGEAQTYNDRHRRHELSQPLEYDAIVLPLVSSARVVEPKRVERQRMPLGGQVTSVFPARYLWKAYPWQEQHAEFVTRWKQSQNENDRYELFLWCEQQELFDCSEFLLRRALFDHQARADSPAYRWYLAKWKEQGSHQRRSPFTFTLPVSGQWKVLPDSDRHHQAKHWSVWAWDMVKPRYEELRYGDDRVENYYSWRQPVYAVGDGVVVAAVDRFPDHQTGVKVAGRARQLSAPRLRRRYLCLLWPLAAEFAAGECRRPGQTRRGNRPRGQLRRQRRASSPLHAARRRRLLDPRPLPNGGVDHGRVASLRW